MGKPKSVFNKPKTSTPAPTPAPTPTPTPTSTPAPTATTTTTTTTSTKKPPSVFQGGTGVNGYSPATSVQPPQPLTTTPMAEPVQPSTDTTTYNPYPTGSYQHDMYDSRVIPQTAMDAHLARPTGEGLENISQPDHAPLPENKMVDMWYGEGGVNQTMTDQVMPPVDATPEEKKSFERTDVWGTTPPTKKGEAEKQIQVLLADIHIRNTSGDINSLRSEIEQIKSIMDNERARIASEGGASMSSYTESMLINQSALYKESKFRLERLEGELSEKERYLESETIKKEKWESMSLTEAADASFAGGLSFTNPMSLASDSVQQPIELGLGTMPIDPLTYTPNIQSHIQSPFESDDSIPSWLPQAAGAPEEGEGKENSWDRADLLAAMNPTQQIAQAENYVLTDADLDNPQQTHSDVVDVMLTDAKAGQGDPATEGMFLTGYDPVDGTPTWVEVRKDTEVTVTKVDYTTQIIDGKLVKVGTDGKILKDGEDVKVTRTYTSLDPDSEEGKILQEAYAGQNYKKHLNQLQKERFDATISGKITLGSFLAESGGDIELSAEWAKSAGIALDTPMGAISFSPKDIDPKQKETVSLYDTYIEQGYTPADAKKIIGDDWETKTHEVIKPLTKADDPRIQPVGLDPQTGYVDTPRSDIPSWMGGYSDTWGAGGTQSQPTIESPYIRDKELFAEGGVSLQDPTGRTAQSTEVEWNLRWASEYLDKYPDSEYGTTELMFTLFTSADAKMDEPVGTTIARGDVLDTVKAWTMSGKFGEGASIGVKEKPQTFFVNPAHTVAYDKLLTDLATDWNASYMTPDAYNTTGTGVGYSRIYLQKDPETGELIPTAMGLDLIRSKGLIITDAEYAAQQSHLFKTAIKEDSKDKKIEQGVVTFSDTGLLPPDAEPKKIVTIGQTFGAEPKKGIPVFASALTLGINVGTPDVWVEQEKAINAFNMHPWKSTFEHSETTFSAEGKVLAGGQGVEIRGVYYDEMPTDMTYSEMVDRGIAVRSDFVDETKYLLSRGIRPAENIYKMGGQLTDTYIAKQPEGYEIYELTFLEQTMESLMSAVAHGGGTYLGWTDTEEFNPDGTRNETYEMKFGSEEAKGRLGMTLEESWVGTKDKDTQFLKFDEEKGEWYGATGKTPAGHESILSRLGIEAKREEDRGYGYVPWGTLAEVPIEAALMVMPFKIRAPLMVALKIVPTVVKQTAKTIVKPISKNVIARQLFSPKIMESINAAPLGGIKTQMVKRTYAASTAAEQTAINVKYGAQQGVKIFRDYSLSPKVTTALKRVADWDVGTLHPMKQRAGAESGTMFRRVERVLYPDMKVQAGKIVQSRLMHGIEKMHSQLPTAVQRVVRPVGLSLTQWGGRREIRAFGKDIAPKIRIQGKLSFDDIAYEKFGSGTRYKDLSPKLQKLVEDEYDAQAFSPPMPAPLDFTMSRPELLTRLATDTASSKTVPSTKAINPKTGEWEEIVNIPEKQVGAGDSTFGIYAPPKKSGVVKVGDEEIPLDLSDAVPTGSDSLSLGRYGGEAFQYLLKKGTDQPVVVDLNIAEIGRLTMAPADIQATAKSVTSSFMPKITPYFRPTGAMPKVVKAGRPKKFPAEPVPLFATSTKSVPYSQQIRFRLGLDDTVKIRAPRQGDVLPARSGLTQLEQKLWRVDQEGVAQHRFGEKYVNLKQIERDEVARIMKSGESFDEVSLGVDFRLRTFIDYQMGGVNVGTSGKYTAFPSTPRSLKVEQYSKLMERWGVVRTELTGLAKKPVLWGETSYIDDVTKKLTTISKVKRKEQLMKESQSLKAEYDELVGKRMSDTDFDRYGDYIGTWVTRQDPKSGKTVNFLRVKSRDWELAGTEAYVAMRPVGKGKIRRKAPFIYIALSKPKTGGKLGEFHGVGMTKKQFDDLQARKGFEGLNAEWNPKTNQIEFKGLTMGGKKLAGVQGYEMTAKFEKALAWEQAASLSEKEAVGAFRQAGVTHGFDEGTIGKVSEFSEISFIETGSGTAKTFDVNVARSTIFDIEDKLVREIEKAKGMTDDELRDSPFGSAYMVDVPVNQYTVFEGTTWGKGQGFGSATRGETVRISGYLAELLEKQAAPELWARNVAFQRGLLGAAKPTELTEIMRKYMKEAYGSKFVEDVQIKGRKQPTAHEGFKDEELKAFVSYFSKQAEGRQAGLVPEKAREISRGSLLPNLRAILRDMEQSHFQFQGDTASWQAQGLNQFKLAVHQVDEKFYMKETGEEITYKKWELAQDHSGTLKAALARAEKSGLELDVDDNLMATVNLLHQTEFYMKQPKMSPTVLLHGKGEHEAFASYKRLKGVIGGEYGWDYARKVNALKDKADKGYEEIDELKKLLGAQMGEFHGGIKGAKQVVKLHRGLFADQNENIQTVIGRTSEKHDDLKILRTKWSDTQEQLEKAQIKWQKSEDLHEGIKTELGNYEEKITTARLKVNQSEEPEPVTIVHIMEPQKTKGHWKKHSDDGKLGGYHVMGDDGKPIWVHEQEPLREVFDPSLTGSRYPEGKTILNPKYAEYQQLKQQKVVAEKELKKNKTALRHAIKTEQDAGIEHQQLLVMFTKTDPHIALQHIEEMVKAEIKTEETTKTLKKFLESLPDDLKKANPYGGEWKQSNVMKAMLNRQVYGILNDVNSEKFRYLIEVPTSSTGQPLSLKYVSYDPKLKQQFLKDYSHLPSDFAGFPYQRMGDLDTSGYKIRIAGSTIDDAAEVYARTFQILEKYNVTAKLGWGLGTRQKGKLLTAYIPQSMRTDKAKLSQFLGEIEASMKGYTGDKGFTLGADLKYEKPLTGHIKYRFELKRDTEEARQLYKKGTQHGIIPEVYRYPSEPLPKGFKDELGGMKIADVSIDEGKYTIFPSSTKTKWVAFSEAPKYGVKVPKKYFTTKLDWHQRSIDVVDDINIRYDILPKGTIPDYLKGAGVKVRKIPLSKDRQFIAWGIYTNLDPKLDFFKTTPIGANLYSSGGGRGFGSNVFRTGNPFFRTGKMEGAPKDIRFGNIIETTTEDAMAIMSAHAPEFASLIQKKGVKLPEGQKISPYLSGVEKKLLGVQFSRMHIFAGGQVRIRQDKIAESYAELARLQYKRDTIDKRYSKKLLKLEDQLEDEITKTKLIRNVEGSEVKYQTVSATDSKKVKELQEKISKLKKEHSSLSAGESITTSGLIDEAYKTIRTNVAEVKTLEGGRIEIQKITESTLNQKIIESGELGKLSAVKLGQHADNIKRTQKSLEQKQLEQYETVAELQALETRGVAGGGDPLQSAYGGDMSRLNVRWVVVGTQEIKKDPTKFGDLMTGKRTTLPSIASGTYPKVSWNEYDLGTAYTQFLPTEEWGLLGKLLRASDTPEYAGTFARGGDVMDIFTRRQMDDPSFTWLTPSRQARAEHSTPFEKSVGENIQKRILTQDELKLAVKDLFKAKTYENPDTGELAGTMVGGRPKPFTKMKGWFGKIGTPLKIGVGEGAPTRFHIAEIEKQLLVKYGAPILLRDYKDSIMAMLIKGDVIKDSKKWSQSSRVEWYDALGKQTFKQKVHEKLYAESGVAVSLRKLRARMNDMTWKVLTPEVWGTRAGKGELRIVLDKDGNVVSYTGYSTPEDLFKDMRAMQQNVVTSKANLIKWQKSLAEAKGIAQKYSWHQNFKVIERVVDKKTQVVKKVDRWLTLKDIEKKVVSAKLEHDAMMAGYDYSQKQFMFGRFGGNLGIVPSEWAEAMKKLAESRRESITSAVKMLRDPEYKISKGVPDETGRLPDGDGAVESGDYFLKMKSTEKGQQPIPKKKPEDFAHEDSFLGLQAQFSGYEIFVKFPPQYIPPKLATGFMGYQMTGGQVPMAAAVSPIEPFPSFDLTKGDKSVTSLPELASLNIEGLQLQPQIIGMQGLLSNRADNIFKPIVSHPPIYVEVVKEYPVQVQAVVPVPPIFVPQQYTTMREAVRPIPRTGVLPPALPFILPPPQASRKKRKRRKAPKRKKKKIWWDVPEQPLGEAWSPTEYVVFTGAEPSKVSKREKRKGLDSILGFDFRD